MVELMVEVAGLERQAIVESASVDRELQMDSIAFVELQVAIEEEYGIVLDPVRVIEQATFGGIADYVFGLVAAVRE